MAAVGRGRYADDEDDDGGCYCAGQYPSWDYHHPRGCGKNPHSFRSVSGVEPDEAWDEPRTGEVEADD